MHPEQVNINTGAGPQFNAREQRIVYNADGGAARAEALIAQLLDELRSGAYSDRIALPVAAELKAAREAAASGRLDRAGGFLESAAKAAGGATSLVSSITRIVSELNGLG